MTQELPPFLPELLLLQEREDPRTGENGLQAIRRNLDSNGLDAVYDDVNDPTLDLMDSLGVSSYANIANVVAWDKYRQVYRFDEELAAMLGDGVGKVPAEALDHLPADSLYITFCKDQGAVVSRCSHGLLITHMMSVDPKDSQLSKNTARAIHAIRDLSVASPATYTLPWGGTIDYAYKSQVSTRVLDRWMSQKLAQDVESQVSALLGRYLGCALYLASQNAEISEVKEPRTAHTKRNRKRFPGRRPCIVHDAGYRVLKVIRQDRTQASDPLNPGTGSPKAPHIRRAHWHTYHHGPKGSPTDTYVRWIPPIAVNSDIGDPDVTIRDI